MPYSGQKNKVGAAGIIKRPYVITRGSSVAIFKFHFKLRTGRCNHILSGSRPALTNRHDLESYADLFTRQYRVSLALFRLFRSNSLLIGQGLRFAVACLRQSVCAHYEFAVFIVFYKFEVIVQRHGYVDIIMLHIVHSKIFNLNLYIENTVIFISIWIIGVNFHLSYGIRKCYCKNTGRVNDFTQAKNSAELHTATFRNNRGCALA